MSLAVMVPMALAGALRYRQNPDVDMQTMKVLLLALGGVVGAVAGAHLVRQIPGPLLRKAFALFIVVVGVRMLVTPERINPRHAPPAAQTP